LQSRAQRTSLSITVDGYDRSPTLTDTPSFELLSTVDNLTAADPADSTVTPFLLPDTTELFNVNEPATNRPDCWFDDTVACSTVANPVPRTSTAP
jgi:hypothetical protein